MAVARSNGLGCEEFEDDDDASLPTISPGFGELEAGWVTGVGILSRLRARSLREWESAERSSGSWWKASSKFAAVTTMSGLAFKTSVKGSSAQISNVRGRYFH